MPFDAAPLCNAVQRLREGLARHQAKPCDEQLRDGLIQQFTYELSHRTLRRDLSEMSPSPEDVARLSFAGLIRVGSDAGLLRSPWPAWRGFREMRTRTSHTDDAAAAELVVAAIPEFLAEAEHLCGELERRSA